MHKRTATDDALTRRIMGSGRHYVDRLVFKRSARKPINSFPILHDTMWKDITLFHSFLYREQLPERVEAGNEPFWEEGFPVFAIQSITSSEK